MRRKRKPTHAVYFIEAVTFESQVASRVHCKCGRTFTDGSRTGALAIHSRHRVEALKKKPFVPGLARVPRAAWTHVFQGGSPGLGKRA
jgi:hypothetical protein